MEKTGIYRAIADIIGELGGIPKSKFNKEQQFHYRPIDAIYDALNSCLRKHKVVILPEVVDHKFDRFEAKGMRIHSWAKVKFTLICAEDGSQCTAVSCGEGLDTWDKSMSKALTFAFKKMAEQVFCISITNDDPEETGGQLESSAPPAPVAGRPPISEYDSAANIINQATTLDALTKLKHRVANRSIFSKEEKDSLAKLIDDKLAKISNGQT